MAIPHPYFGPVILSSSRKTQSRGMSFSTSTSYIFVLTIRRMSHHPANYGSRITHLAHEICEIVQYEHSCQCPCNVGFESKADTCPAPAHVRFTPKADIHNPGFLRGPRKN